MEINVTASAGICAEYRKDINAEAAEISVVIAPLKIIQDEDSGKAQIISGCNMFRSCHNLNCWYSLEARQSKKKSAGK